MINPDWSAGSAEGLELEDYSLRAQAVVANLLLAEVVASEQ